MASKRQCAGTVNGAKNPNRGKPCSNWAMPGSDFCGVHGGSVKIATAKPSDLRNRCTAKSSRTGERCKKAAINGGTVCTTHGGAAAHVAKKARERFNDLIDPMINIAERQVEAALSGQMSHSDEMALMKFIADRTGFTPGSHVEVTVKPWEETIQKIFKEGQPAIMSGLSPDEMAEIEAAREAERLRYADVIDAEVVEEDEFVPSDHSNVISFDTPIVGSANPPRRRR